MKTSDRETIYLAKTPVIVTGRHLRRNGDVVFGVRQSRLGIKGNYGEDIAFILEAELLGVGGDEGQTTPRLRHAWATYKNFGMGQTWSNFMDMDIFPNTIDYWGQREDVSGNIGSDYRIQFSLKVNFDTGDLMQKN